MSIIDLLDSVKVRELETKYSINLTDLMIIEDNDGTKTTPVSSFQSILTNGLFFNTIEDLKSASFTEGSIAITLGYHHINDGGGGIYIIKYSPTDLDDGGLVHYLHTSDTLRAHLVYGDKVNILQLGAYGDGEHDDSEIFNNAIRLGLPIYIPQREYKLNAPIEITKSDLSINFNGAILNSPISSSICIGLNDEECSNIRIHNANIKGLSGIELYSSASGIFIDDISIMHPDKNMSFGIEIAGATNIQISNLKIGNSSSYSLSKGIIIKSISKAGSDYAPDNINITDSTIEATDYCITLESQDIIDRVTIDNCILHGKSYNNQNDNEQVIIETKAINVSSNIDNLMILNCDFSDLDTAINIPGVVGANVFSFNNICRNALYMYNLSSNKSILGLSGFQSYKGLYNPSKEEDYIFNNITGTLYLLNSNFMITDPSRKVKWFVGNHNTGTVVDQSSPFSRVDNYDDSDITNNTLTLRTITSTSVYYQGTADSISSIVGGLKGQVISLYSENDTILQSSDTIKLANEVSNIVLSKNIPITLRNVNGKWTQI